MSRILDRGSETFIASEVLSLLEENGYTPEEIIPGLIEAVTLAAERTGDPEGALDEASNLLAETGVE